MAFCPECKYEYNPGVEACPECGSALVAQLPQEESAVRPKVPLVKVAEGMRPMVEMLGDMLRRRGIRSLVRPRGPAWQMEWPGVSFNAEILIRSDDLEQHRDFIEGEARRMGDHIIWFPGSRD